MTGHPPFKSSSRDPGRVYRDILKGIDEVRFPVVCSGAVGDVIRSLCRLDPSDRLPMRMDGITKLKQCEWFADIDWESLLRCQTDPPHKPVVKSSTDMRNFCPGQPPARMKYVDDGSNWDLDF